MNIRAIETHYAGCRFRSRTEARWACFFNKMSWDWEFEPQGFETPNGRYLPDFKVASSSGTHWFEVKPFTSDLPNEERWYDVVDGTGLFMIVAYGMHRVGDSCKEAWSDNKLQPHAGRIILPGKKTHMLGPFWTEPQYTDAWNAASAARFEFGESG